MSREQLMSLYRRQVAQGGSSSGGLFTAQSRAGLAEYRAWHQEYKMQHPMATRDEFKMAWRQRKAAMGESPPKASGLVGGARMSMGLRQFARGPRGSGLVGGARMSKGLRHCVPGAEIVQPSGLKRCSRFAAGPAGASRGSGLVGGAVSPGLAMYQEFRRMHPGVSRPELSAMWRAHKSQIMGGLLKK